MVRHRIPIQYSERPPVALLEAVRETVAELNRLKVILKSQVRTALGRCPACGSDTFVEGRLEGADDAVFRSLQGGLTMRSLVPNRVRACAKCGTMQLLTRRSSGDDRIGADRMRADVSLEARQGS